MSVQLANATISDEALVSIVRGAVGRVEGVRLDQPGRVSRVLPGRRGAVSWELDARGVAFDVDVAASYGVPLRRAAADVREQVAAAVIGMTGLPVRSVDVTVTGVER
jgi:uncharacterized alkaline shock family protein YloU